MIWPRDHIMGFSEFHIMTIMTISFKPWSEMMKWFTMVWAWASHWATIPCYMVKWFSLFLSFHMFNSFHKFKSCHMSIRTKYFELISVILIHLWWSCLIECDEILIERWYFRDIIEGRPTKIPMYDYKSNCRVPNSFTTIHPQQVSETATFSTIALHVLGKPYGKNSSFFLT